MKLVTRRSGAALLVAALGSGCTTTRFVRHADVLCLAGSPTSDGSCRVTGTGDDHLLVRDFEGDVVHLSETTRVELTLADHTTFRGRLSLTRGPAEEPSAPSRPTSFRRPLRASVDLAPSSREPGLRLLGVGDARRFFGLGALDGSTLRVRQPAPAATVALVIFGVLASAAVALGTAFVVWFSQHPISFSGLGMY